ncbi:MAG: SRPBCC domain-containing protein [Burkholderiales bacterium]|nr:SRPBCC domain-containing protein [Burkholderiales bacterium]
MLQLHSSIDIDASASLVWAILTDFASCKRWNPFIRAILGKPSSGNRLRLTVQRQGEPPLSTTSTLTYLREPRELRWRQQRLVPALFATEHRFRIESLPAGGVRFHLTEQVEGLFASLLGRGRQRATEESFHLMNHALKARAERLGSRFALAGDATT